jgi:DNA-binding HxlR family transcriptional regulator
MCSKFKEGIPVMAGSASIAPLCSIAAPMEIMGGRWKAPILYYLLSSGTQRFGAIRRFCLMQANACSLCSYASSKPTE